MDMEVLFVCKGNYGRSQMAEAIFNSLAKGRATASSAGADAAVAGQGRLADRAPLVVNCMKDMGLDVSRNESRVLTREMFDRADIVVSMVGRDALPLYAQKAVKVEYWDVEDPHYMDYVGHVGIRDQIYGNVAELVEKLKSRERSK